MAKSLFAVRHSDKNYAGRNESSLKQRIGAAGFQLVQKLADMLNKLGWEFSDIFAGELPRTWETAAGFLSKAKVTSNVTLHDHLEIGNSNIFGKYLTKRVIHLIAHEGMTNWHAVQNGLSPELLDEFKQFALSGIQDAFSKMTGDTGILFGHSPILEAAVEALGVEVTTQPGSCEGYRFEEKDGEITVTNTVKIK